MFYIVLDIGPLLGLDSKIEGAARQVMAEAGRRLAAETHAHIIEEAHKKLHARRQMFVDHCTLIPVDQETFIVNLDAKMRWIDDGLPAGREMIDDLLKSPKAKHAKDGSKYLSVPFRHGPGVGAASATPAQMDLTNTIKAEFAKRKIQFGGLEKDANGNAKQGLLHKIDINNQPVRTQGGPGQGKGPIGQVKQGPTGIPLLQGIRVYQREVTHPDGSKGTRKDIMTFRTVSSKMKGSGRWVHPGLQPVLLMDDGYQWALDTWEHKIVPQIFAQFVSAI